MLALGDVGGAAVVVTVAPALLPPAPHSPDNRGWNETTR